MRLAILSTLLALLAPVAAEARPDNSPDRALAGRTPGNPVTCIDLTRIDDSQTYESGAILYRMRGGPDYLNTPPGCAGTLRSDSLLVMRTPGTQLCRGDIVEVRDRMSPIPHGSCGLGDFVPYPKPPRAAR